MALVVAAVVAVVVWHRVAVVSVAAVLVVTSAAALVGRRSFGVGLILLAGVAAVRSDRAHHGLAPDDLGPFAGWATVALDPQPGPGTTRLVLQIDGERFECWVRGRAGQQRVARWQQGDQVWVAGQRRQLSAERAGRVAWQHVVGQFDRDYFGDRRAGRPLAVAANRVRELVRRGAGALDSPHDALARGLIIGDDREQPPEMVARFRASGLSHLTAVSGQNVAYVLAAAAPLLRRIRAGPRLAVTTGLILWFVVLTRAEPSILRAGVMAILAVVAVTLGREREPARLLAVAVTGLLLLDPLLVRSVGFWLSVGATAGVTILAAPLARRLGRLGPMALPAAVTLGAQAGVAIPSLVVFGRLSFVGTFANLLAVPVAGLVMLYGLPAALLAGAVAPVAPVLMLPVGLGVRWVDAVAAAGAGIDPPPVVNLAGWVVVLSVVAWLARPRRRSAELRQ